MRIAYGYRVKESNDPFLTDVEVAVEQFSLSTAPGGFLVNLVPARVYLFDTIHRNVLPNKWTVRHIPAWFPGAGFKHTAALWAESLINMVERPYKFVKLQIVNHLFLCRTSHSTLCYLVGCGNCATILCFSPPRRVSDSHRQPRARNQMVYSFTIFGWCGYGMSLSPAPMSHPINGNG